MDLQKEWQIMDGEIAAVGGKLSINMKEIKVSSKDAYEKLVDGLHVKLVWIQVIAVAALAGTLFTDGLLRTLLLIWFVAYAFGAILTRHRLDKLPRSIDYSKATRHVISAQITAVKAILKLEGNAVYFFGPFAGPSGLLAGLLLKFKTLDAVVQRFPNIWIYLLATASLVFLIKWLGDKLNKMAFKENLDRLERHLDAMEEC